MNIYGLRKFSFENSSKLAISHLFCRFHTFFSHLFQFLSSSYNPPINCNKNIYGLRKFSIENSYKLAISHLFWRFNTFFSHLFQIIFSSCNPPTQLLQEYTWFTLVFYWKFRQISDFTPFLEI